ncbi:MAG: GvpL/GvpF family gas vesicle protein [Mariniphaga sp.]|nr:GvpL/GvpF family gas vesicle protein [Mariniphaga sp.]
MEPKEIYIYGVVPNFYEAEHFRSLNKLGVYFISFQNISALVSDREIAHFDLSDRESLAHLLVHHQKTVEGIMSIGFNMILPAKLGTIVQTKDEVLNILSNGHDLIITTLKKIEYLTEIDVAITWADFSGLLKEISVHPEIIIMKDDILKKTDLLSKVDQVKVGMMVQAKLTEKNKATELKILDTLSSFCHDVKMHEVMNDQMITNSAFLINRNNIEKFEQAINELDEEFEGLLNFKLVGPLPCYSFYTIEVKELNLEQVELAIKELELKEETSESEIKKAFLEKARLFHPDVNADNSDVETFNRINEAYHTLLDYSASERQNSKEGFFSLAKEEISKNLILIKIKE